MPGLVSELEHYCFEFTSIWSPIYKQPWHKTDGHQALLLLAIQEWLPLPTFMASLPGMNLNIFPGIEQQRLADSEGASDIRTIEIATLHLETPLWRLHWGEPALSIVAFRGRHTRSRPQLPLATPEADSEVVHRKGKSSAKEVSVVEKGNTPSLSVKTPFSDF